MTLTKDQIHSLLSEGYVSLPQFKITEEDKDFFISSIENEKITGYHSNYEPHERYIDNSGIKSSLSSQLKSIAKDKFNINCNINDIYKITRIIKSSHTNEQFRFHFDSHLFTLVTPIHIPLSSENSKGELILVPLLRQEPFSELYNSITKLYYKRYASSNSMSKIKAHKSIKYFDFKNNEPLLFLGRSCFHANNKFNSLSDENRITVLTHFFDPSPNFSFGRIMRLIRNR